MRRRVKRGLDRLDCEKKGGKEKKMYADRQGSIVPVEERGSRSLRSPEREGYFQNQIGDELRVDVEAEGRTSSPQGMGEGGGSPLSPLKKMS